MNLRIRDSVNKKIFIQWIEEQKKSSEAVDAAYKAGVDLINFSECFLQPNLILRAELFTVEDIDWIDWYTYERDPDSLEPQAYDGDTPICQDIDGLWDLMVLKVEKED